MTCEFPRWGLNLTVLVLRLILGFLSWWIALALNFCFTLVTSVTISISLCNCPSDPLAGKWLLQPVNHIGGFPRGSVLNNCLQCRNCWRLRSDPWVGRIPWRRKWQPSTVLLPGKPHGQRSLAGYSPWGHTELDTAEAG